MRSLLEPPDLSRRQTFSLWLVICLCLFPMVVPVFTTLSANQDASKLIVIQPLLDNDPETARPLKAEVVDNSDVVPAGLDAPGYSIGSVPDMFLALLTVLCVTYLGWRFTLRHHVRQIK